MNLCGLPSTFSVHLEARDLCDDVSENWQAYHHHAALSSVSLFKNERSEAAPTTKTK